jgi:subtilase family serine protease
MRRPHFAALTSVAALCISVVALAPSASAAPSSNGLSHRNDRVCADATDGYAACQAIRHDTVTSSGKAAPASSTIPSTAKRASDIQSAYNIPAATNATVGGTNGRTIAIVDAYNAPYAEKDLGVYRSAMGLSSCTTANGCFTKVNQSGGSSMPRNNGGWAQEISLDLDMASAACPDCKILLVEASSASFTNLAAAVNTAARLGAKAISNSYGGSDSTASGTIGQAYNKSNVAITASTGDNGYQVQSPASFAGVVAVGGTSLTGSSSTGWTQSAWSGAGSGCSTLNARPAYQDPAATQCPNGKATADVSAVADPNTGVAVYDSYSYQGYSGWMQFGGTSASSPIIASLYAQAADFGSSAGAYTWGHATSLTDVSGGNNGTCSTAVWCQSGPGWDGPTGLGTPNGLGAF